MDVSEPASISYGIASRYAQAVFEISRDSGKLGDLDASVATLAEAIQVSEDLRDMIASPVYSREAQTKAIAAVAEKLGLVPELASTLGLMAQKRRLFTVPQLVQRLGELLAEARGEVTADVTSATPLTAEQADKLAAALAESIGKTVKLNTTVDESLIAGLVVKVGSRMVDTSIRSKLNALQNVMKEVG
ncbi:F0F1 ATP synthase subunit delta [Pseudooceanicola sp. CBS1P-1]|uniref:ATP synthase subunit delta n=1 Tax=Pseudooceanicola albus TaxID=2692189 RepID=A0A6L7G4Q4_9RHOB|nr:MULTISPECIES: F0F1 ATP synthase subunit delta [Pseudooceanicola]MBT9384649.1 F0F1 ATP synthase subunit delta [Pseudooceanicola endophyticus]MXN18350.1 F0F1 ATP synthase subunit delta [Pseudooceanicola albus]